MLGRILQPVETTSFNSHLVPTTRSERERERYFVHNPRNPIPPSASPSSGPHTSLRHYICGVQKLLKDFEILAREVITGIFRDTGAGMGKLRLAEHCHPLSPKLIIKYSALTDKVERNHWNTKATTFYCYESRFTPQTE